LEAANWKKTIAARRLGMSRATLWRKMEKYGISGRFSGETVSRK